MCYIHCRFSHYFSACQTFYVCPFVYLCFHLYFLGFLICKLLRCCGQFLLVIFCITTLKSRTLIFVNNSHVSLCPSLHYKGSRIKISTKFPPKNVATKLEINTISTFIHEVKSSGYILSSRIKIFFLRADQDPVFFFFKGRIWIQFSSDMEIHLDPQPFKSKYRENVKQKTNSGSAEAWNGTYLKLNLHIWTRKV